jgi:preprotein translocase subunit SecE
MSNTALRNDGVHMRRMQFLSLVIVLASRVEWPSATLPVK